MIFSIFQMAIGHHVKFCLPRGSGGPRLAKFCQNLLFLCRDIAILMAATATLYFHIHEILLDNGVWWVAGCRRITVLNFVKIGQSVAEILLFFKFLRWLMPPSLIFKLWNFIDWQVLESQDKSCQILSKLVNPLLRYWDFSIFQDGHYPPSWIRLRQFYTTHGE